MRRLAYGSAFDEFGFGAGLALVVLAAGYVLRPAHDPSHHLMVIPADVGDDGPAPSEAWIWVGDEQRDVTRSENSLIR